VLFEPALPETNQECLIMRHKGGHMGEVIKLTDYLRRKIQRTRVFDGSIAEKLFRHYNQMRIWEVEATILNTKRDCPERR